MENEVKLHDYQKALVRKLALGRNLTFNRLLIEGLGSEHMNYHLKRLLEVGFVIKRGTFYTLTDQGKDYSNRLDDAMKTVEKQPKTSVIINAVRKNDKGEIEFLLNKRLREPYFGKVGRMGGKVLFGETTEAAARRELLEESGLIAEKLILEEIYRKIRSRKDGTKVQDVFFYIYFTKNPSGTLINKTDHQENFWITKKELYERRDLDPYDDLLLDERLSPKKFKISENEAEAEGY
ncbi:hypothetical protein A2801_02240 [Candidatus Woesebacteria bacterium RIFCSPHIGHO2_01_FULL_41_10]|uniref:Nudix hydrolase domain-containing protein n=1 Tax=Candidatus Woesebacteria bacterium RIFCSPHIGHO2_01_FULL_41_10 TaxID=1802500 RepID=A0A1F7YR03_9BACT|nr:MAG: hypothetical protein A2801_02240 [Candidatus Woesebacteria bacterium RIFCSPHIGHO2_01_FULL_41_10]